MYCLLACVRACLTATHAFTHPNLPPPPQHPTPTHPTHKTHPPTCAASCSRYSISALSLGRPIAAVLAATAARASASARFTPGTSIFEFDDDDDEEEDDDEGDARTGMTRGTGTGCWWSWCRSGGCRRGCRHACRRGVEGERKAPAAESTNSSRSSRDDNAIVAATTIHPGKAAAAGCCCLRRGRPACPCACRSPPALEAARYVQARRASFSSNAARLLLRLAGNEAGGAICSCLECIQGS